MNKNSIRLSKSLIINILTFTILVQLFLQIPLHAQWQAPIKGPELKVQTFCDKAKIKPGSTAKIAFLFNLERNWHINSNRPLDEFLVPTILTLDQMDAIEVEKIIYPEPKLVRLSFSEEPLSVFEGEFLVGVEVKIKETEQPGITVELPFSLRYQACDDKQCLPPKTLKISYKIDIENTDIYASEEVLAIINKINWEKPTDTTEPPSPPPQGSTVTSSNTAEIQTATTPPSLHGDWKELVKSFKIIGRLDGYAGTNEFIEFLDSAIKGEPTKVQSKSTNLSLYTLLLILIGGLALNLTPCVLPVIPLNIAIIGAGARAGSKVRGFLLGGAYGAGIALVYGGLGIAVVLGFSKTFGTINSTAWFNGIISILFLLLGLAMFDVFLLDFSKFQAYIKLDKFRRGSFTLAFIMGGISALLAGACVAPVVISTIIHAQDLYSQGFRMAIFLPLLLGVGMALPWPLLGAGLSLMPKPGKWTEYVKYAFGVLLIGVALYYGYTAYTIYTAKPENLTTSDGWHNSLYSGLEESLHTGKPMIIDFWATWCKNCIVMNKRVLTAPEVKEKLNSFVKVKFQAENPNEPKVREVLELFQVLGLPTFIILSPEKKD